MLYPQIIILAGAAMAAPQNSVFTFTANGATQTLSLAAASNTFSVALPSISGLAISARQAGGQGQTRSFAAPSNTLFSLSVPTSVSFTLPSSFSVAAPSISGLAISARQASVFTFTANGVTQTLSLATASNTFSVAVPSISGLAAASNTFSIALPSISGLAISARQAGGQGQGQTRSFAAPSNTLFTLSVPTSVSFALPTTFSTAVPTLSAI